MKATTAAATCLVLFMLCACAAQGQNTATLPPVPTPTALPAPTNAPAPSPVPTTAPSAPALRSDATGVIDLALQVQSPPAIAGAENTYTLTVRNHGPDPATGIVLTSTLPAGVLPVWTMPAQPVCGRLGSAVDCDLGALRGNDAATVTLDLSVGGTGTLVSSTQLAGVHWDLSAPTCILDAGVGRVACYVERLASGASVSLRVGARVEAGVSGALVHTAAVTANETDVDWSSNLVTATLTVAADAPLAAPSSTDLVLQASAPQDVVAGEPFTYTYTVANRGALEATGVTLQYPVPPATVLSAYAPSLPLCQQRDDTFTCRLYNPDSGELVTFTLVITGRAGQPMLMYLDQLTPGWPACIVLKESEQIDLLNCDLGTLEPGQASQVYLLLVAQGVVKRVMTNTALVSANEAELNALDNTHVSTVSVQVQADLALGSVSGPVMVDQTLSYTLTVTNAGPSDANEALLSAALPPGATLVSLAAGQGRECQQEPGAALVCDLGRLESGNAITVAIVVALDLSLPPGTTGTLTYSASVAAKQPDPDPTNNQVTESIPIGNEGD